MPSKGKAFVFIGREAFKPRTGPPAPPQNVAGISGKPSADDLAAFRITSDSFTYASSSKRGGGPSFPGFTKTEGHKPGNMPPPHARRNLREVFEGQQVETLDGSLGSDNRDLTIFGADTRTQITPTETEYPYAVIGQIYETIGAVAYTCSGALVSPTSVLTAGHCVHEGGSTGSYLNGVKFTPALDGKRVPFGTWRFKYLTVFGGWKKKRNFDWDMGVITYYPNEHGLPGDYIGWLPMEYPLLVDNTCTVPSLSTTGYPGDKKRGTMWSTQCPEVKLDCDGFVGKTACDVYPGQSGSPVYSSPYVYGVVSFQTTEYLSTTVYTDSDFPTQFNGFNMLNSKKWPSIIAWISQA